MGGVRYTGGLYTPLGRDAYDIGIGSRVPVVYDSQDPTISCVCDPAANTRTWWQKAATALLFGLYVVGLAWFLYGLNRRTKRRPA